MEQELMDRPVSETPSPPRRPKRPPPGAGWARLAAALSALSLAVSCIALVMVMRMQPAPPEEPELPPEPEGPVPTIQYRDQVIPVLEDVAVNEYDMECFSTNDLGWLTYQKDGQSAAVGIDVSAYQGDVDWQQAADAGISFAMIRAGYRGYSKGAIFPDACFEQNIQGALDAGLEVGVYFFSQATSVWEAEEEAEYILQAIEGYDVTYPVAFDWESIPNTPDARTNGMTPAQVTRFAGAFCDLVAAAGYDPVVYFNQDLGYLSYQLDALDDYTFWLAEYNPLPSFYYDFDLWQYSHRGTVPGIQGSVDLNLDFRPLKGPSE